MTLESQWRQSLSRRRALVRLAGFLAGSPLFGATVRAQLDPRPMAGIQLRIAGFTEMAGVFDFEPVMFGNVPLVTYNYTAHGDGSEFTLRRNREAFDWVELIPAKPVEPERVDLTTVLFGARMKFPIIVAPTAFQGPLHPEGEVGMRKAAVAAGTAMILSHNSTAPIEKVAAAAAGPLWAQVYPQEDRDTGRELLDRVQAAGCSAVVITVDQQASYYERSQRTRNLGGGPRPAARAGGPTAGPPRGIARYRVSSVRLWYTWSYLDEIRKLIKVPMLLKGVMTPEDATRALDHGVDGLIVSNHGGRSMDYGPSTLEVLPEIVDAVNRRVPVLTDSGYRRGADILKALALGANGVLVGRPTRWGLGAFGTAGAQRVLEILQRELVAAAAASGRPTIASIDKSLVRTRFP